MHLFASSRVLRWTIDNCVVDFSLNTRICTPVWYFLFVVGRNSYVYAKEELLLNEDHFRVEHSIGKVWYLLSGIHKLPQWLGGQFNSRNILNWSQGEKN